MALSSSSPRLVTVTAMVLLSIAVLAQQVGTLGKSQNALASQTTDEKVAALQRTVTQLNTDVKTLTTNLKQANTDIANLTQGLSIVNRPPQGYSRSFMIKLNWNSIPDDSGFFVFSRNK